jgi:hypothetical protein
LFDVLGMENINTASQLQQRFEEVDLKQHFFRVVRFMEGIKNFSFCV